MLQEVLLAVSKLTGSINVAVVDVIQELWSGYGQLLRVRLNNETMVVVKYVSYPTTQNHPKGWNSDFSHLRKVKSYEVEFYWYQHWNDLQDSIVRTPEYVNSLVTDSFKLLILEDLNEAGYPIRKSRLGINQAKKCLAWLAKFHATYMCKTPKGLWEIGSYWHLSTRPEEFEGMREGQLKQSASLIDKVLNSCQYPTIIHGDAKVANFCFSLNDEVAALDFQYTGAGCGIKDVAYFLSSCLSEDECAQYEEELLQHYFKSMETSLALVDSKLDFNAIEKEYRYLYAYAWADFVRFLEGWSSEHYKLNSYSKSKVRKVLSEISTQNK